MSARPITLVISNISWNFVWQRHQTLASLLARDADVVFCEVLGIRRVGWRDLGRIAARLWSLKSRSASTEPIPTGVRVSRPFLLPATNRIFHAINGWLLKRWLSRQSELAAGVELIWNYSASRSARWLIENVPHRKLVYDCTDDWLAVRGIPRCLPEDERTLLERADLTLVPSRALMERKAPFARRIERVPHGALVERFLVEPKAPPTDGAFTLLYYGHLHAQHLDFSAIDAIARARSTWRIVLVGPVKTPHVFAPNVRLVGQQPHAALRDFVREADVLLLPFVLNTYTQAVLPAKIYECLATGRPVVAAPLPELVADFASHLHFAQSPGEWVQQIERALREDSKGASAARVVLARENSWAQRYERVRGLLASLGAPVE